LADTFVAGDRIDGFPLVIRPIDEYQRCEYADGV